MRWLVTGGAGYIGAHVVAALAGSGIASVVIDDLSTGRAERLPAGVPLIRADVRTASRWARCSADTGSTASSTWPPARTSPSRPPSAALLRGEPRRAAVRSRRRLHQRHALGAVLFKRRGVRHAPHSPVGELDGTAPENAYGRTKLIGEWMLRDAAASAGFRWCALRYFNVAGAGAPHLRDHGGTNLVPRLLRAAAEGRWRRSTARLPDGGRHRGA